MRRHNGRLLRLVVNNAKVLEAVAGAHQGPHSATGRSRLRVICKLLATQEHPSPAADDGPAGRSAAPKRAGRGKSVGIVGIGDHEAARIGGRGTETPIETLNRQLEPLAIGEGQQLPFGTVRPTSPAPVADCAMPHAKGLRDCADAAEFLDKVHGLRLDTHCVIKQGGIEACVAERIRHDGAMATDEKTAFNIAAGRRLARVRTAIGVDQETFAEQLGTSRERIANYEQGSRTPAPDVMVRLHKKHGVPTDYIYHGEVRWLPNWIAERIREQPEILPRIRQTPSPKPRRRVS